MVQLSSNMLPAYTSPVGGTIDSTDGGTKAVLALDRIYKLKMK